MNVDLEGFVRVPAADVIAAFREGRNVEVVQPSDGGMPPPPRFIVGIRLVHGAFEVRLTDGWFFHIDASTPDVLARIDGGA